MEKMKFQIGDIVTPIKDYVIKLFISQEESCLATVESMKESQKAEIVAWQEDCGAAVYLCEFPNQERLWIREINLKKATRKKI